MKLDGLPAVVTGGASGLGAGAARALADAGCKVAILDMNADLGTKLASEVGGVFFETNVTDPKNVSEAFVRARDAHGPCRILVTCAGILRAAVMVKDGSPHPLEIFKQVIDVNLTGTFDCVRIAAAQMADQDPVGPEERGVLIMTASIAAEDGVAGAVAYAASKGGVASMALPLARDLAHYGIRAVAIEPGAFATAMTGGLGDRHGEALVSEAPFPQRWGNPAEFGALVRQIAENPMINGTQLRIDGAMRMRLA